MAEAVFRACCSLWTSGTSPGSHNPSTHPVHLVADEWPNNQRTNSVLSSTVFPPSLPFPHFLQESPSFVQNASWTISLGNWSGKADLIKVVEIASCSTWMALMPVTFLQLSGKFMLQPYAWSREMFSPRTTLLMGVDIDIVLIHIPFSHKGVVLGRQCFLLWISLF